MKKHKGKIQMGIVIGIFSSILITCLVSVFSQLYTENKEKEEFRQLAEIVTEETTDATLEEIVRKPNLLKVSDGFTKLLPTVGSLVLYAISFYFVSIVFRTLSVGLVYAIWSGVGIVLTAIVAYFAFGQKIDTAGLIGMALIICGVLVINLFSQTGH